jgi:mRNA-degrading endonuclease RelE of RelBE toxin-antitoxin system
MKLFYTVHARERMSFRIISEQEVVEAMEKGNFEHQEDDKYQVVYGRVRVVFAVNHEEETVTVVTAIHSKSFTKEIRRYVKKNKVSHTKATKHLKGVA